MLVSEIVILPVLKCRPSQLCMLTKLSHPLTFRATEDANSACARKLHKNGGQSGNRLLVLLVRGEFLVSDDKSCMAVSTTKMQSTQETMVNGYPRCERTMRRPLPYAVELNWFEAPPTAADEGFA